MTKEVCGGQPVTKIAVLVGAHVSNKEGLGLPVNDPGSSPQIDREQAGLSNCCIIAAVCNRGFKTCNRPNPLIRTIKLGKLLNCMASRGFYLRLYV